MTSRKSRSKSVISPENVIVVHPGSLNLYIGRSSDFSPLIMPNCIAHKINSGFPINSDKIIDKVTIDSKKFTRGQEQVIKLLNKMNYSERSSGKNKAREIIDEKSDLLKEEQFYIGNEALDADPEMYELHFPFCFGMLNDMKRTMSGTLDDVCKIISTVLARNFEVTDFSSHRIVLVIPNLFRRSQVSKLVYLFLNEMGFEAVFIQQESVFAVLASGLNRACVVDVGHTKTSVCCVEEGYICPKTRLTFQYGGKNISQVFRNVLMESGLPVESDAVLEKLKAKYCTFIYSYKFRGTVERTVQYLSCDNQVEEEHSITVDSFKLILPPMTLFSSQMMEFIPKYSEIVPDVEQASDDYFSYRPRRYKTHTNENKPDECPDDSSDGGNAAASDHSDDMKYYGQVENLMETKLRENFPSLAKAIVYSLDQCESDDLKARMLTNVLLIGGGLKFKGVHKFLQQAIRTNLPRNLQGNCEISVLSNPRDLEDEVVCWKGASIMAYLESFHDLWIFKSAWNKHGTIIIREKAAFAW